MLTAPLVAASFVVNLCLVVWALKWLLLGRMHEGRFPVCGAYYVRMWFFDRLMDLSLEVIGTLYTTLYLRPWLRALGAMIAANPSSYDSIKWIGYAVGIVNDLVCGGVAGWIAKRRGAAHGALADVVAIVVGFALGTVLNIARGGSFEYLSSGSYWGQWLVMVIPGIGLAAFAGWVAAMFSGSRAPSR